MIGSVVNYNNGDGIVRAMIVRELEDTRVYLWAPERGSGHLKLEKGDGTGVPHRAPADYEAGGGGGVTYHTLDEAEEEAEG